MATHIAGAGDDGKVRWLPELFLLSNASEDISSRGMFNDRKEVLQLQSQRVLF